MLDRALFNFTDLRSDNMLHLKCSKILDHIQPTGLTFQPCGNSRVRFSDLNTLSERNRPLIISVPFFMLTLGLQLVCRVLGGLCPAGFLECRFANLTPDAPFLFSDEKGVYITLGGSL